MSKPRIMIADLDENYIIPLQVKFIEEYFDMIDLEIVTDPQYFNELFSQPQVIDILVVAKELYDTNLKRHNISSIFVLTEQYENGETDDLSIHKLFKYTSIKEIFNVIVGNSLGILQEKTGRQRDCQILLVCSANGGTGKTTVALGMSVSLTQNHKRVLYMNAEHLQVFQWFMDNQSPIGAAEIYARMNTLDDKLYQDIKHVIRKEGFHYIPPFKASLVAIGMTYSIYEILAKAAKISKEYDYIIVDTDSVFNEDKVRLMNLADRVIVVTRQNAASVYATNALAGSINGIDTEKFIFICNDFNKGRDNALISNEYNIKFNIDEYVEHYEQYDQMRREDLADLNGIQKIAFLVM